MELMGFYWIAKKKTQGKHTKNVENQWFQLENDLQMVRSPHLC